MIRPGKQVSATLSLPSPTGGWNSKDPVSNMPETDASVIVNWWPTASDVRVRNGFTTWSTGLPGAVSTLMAYSSASGTNKLFAASVTGIYDCTSAGAVGASVKVITQPRIQYANFTIAGGSYLVCCNGADAVFAYDGATWSNPAITVATPANLIHVNVFKNRLFFVEKNKLSVWYMPTGAIAGAATEINLGTVFQDGGYLMAMGTWTLDAGRGVDDHAVFVTSKGEVAVYAGSDPSSASTWQLVGVYRIGSPIGRACMEKYGGDLLIICLDGVFPLSAALQSDRLSTDQAISDKIRPTISDATGLYGTIDGWQILPYPDQNALIVNIPTSTTTADQYVMNAITGAWTRFTGWNAQSWELFNDQPYFGTSTKVCKAWTGTSDGGSYIMADVKQAFNYCGKRSARKHFKLVRPSIASDGPVIPGIRLNIDFSDDAPTSNGSVTVPSSSAWDSAVWDSGTWGGGTTISSKIQAVSGTGYCAAVRMRVLNGTNAIYWYNTDIVFEYGGLL